MTGVAGVAQSTGAEALAVVAAVVVLRFQLRRGGGGTKNKGTIIAKNRNKNNSYQTRCKAGGLYGSPPGKLPTFLYTFVPWLPR